MKRRTQRKNTLLAGIAGMAVVVVFSLGLNLLAFRGQGQAGDQQPILPTIAMTATPTPPSPPAARPALGNAVLVEREFTGEAALAEWEFVDVGVRLPEDRSVWLVVDGTLLQNRTAAAGNPNIYETMAFTGDAEWADYTVSAQFYDEGNGHAGLVARRQGESFYRLRLLGAFYSDNPKLILEKVVDGTVTTLAASDAPGYATYTWHRMALSVDGAQITASLNGAEVLRAEDSTLTSGQPGLFTLAMGKIRFSDIVVAAQ